MAAQWFEEIATLTWLGNSLQSWIISFGWFLLTYVTLKIVQAVTVARLKPLVTKTAMIWDDWLLVLVEGTKAFFIIGLSFKCALLNLSFTPHWDFLLHKIPVLAFWVQMGVWAVQSLDFALKHYETKSQDTGEVHNVVSLQGPIRIISLILMWSVVGLLILDNFGVNITALVAGLGIGGIAIAFALQQILADVFAAIAIGVDRPFKVGDFIIVDQLKGTVEYIGLKTTRVRSLDGELLIFANSDLLKSRIQNYFPLQERRCVLRVDIVMSTPLSQVKEIPHWLEGIVVAQDGVRFDRAHLHAMTASAFQYEIVYFVEDSDYLRYMDTQQRVLFAILETLEREGVSLAYPTQTIHLNPETPGTKTAVTVGS